MVKQIHALCLTNVSNLQKNIKWRFLPLLQPPSPNHFSEVTRQSVGLNPNIHRGDFRGDSLLEAFCLLSRFCLRAALPSLDHFLTAFRSLSSQLVSHQCVHCLGARLSPRRDSSYPLVVSHLRQEKSLCSWGFFSFVIIVFSLGEWVQRWTGG